MTYFINHLKYSNMPFNANKLIVNQRSCHIFFTGIHQTGERIQRSIVHVMVGDCFLPCIAYTYTVMLGPIS